MRYASTCVMLLVWSVLLASGQAGEKKKTTFKVGHVTVEIDPKLQRNWTFSRFKVDASEVGAIIEGIAQYDGGDPKECRWHAYDKEGVKVKSSPFSERFEAGEKTKFTILMPGKDWKETNVIKIKPK